jgi:hypothetical protein
MSMEERLGDDEYNKCNLYRRKKHITWRWRTMNTYSDLVNACKSNFSRWSKFDPLYIVIGGGVKIC